MTLAMLLLLLGVLVLYAFVTSMVKSPGLSLQGKFVSCNPLRGKPMTDIMAKCGQPTSRHAFANGLELLQWQAPGYHIALLMDDQGTCQGVTFEFLTKNGKSQARTSLADKRPSGSPQSA